MRTGFVIAVFLFFWTLGLICLWLWPQDDTQYTEPWSPEEKAAVVAAMRYHGVGSAFGKEVNGSITYHFKRNGKTCKMLTWNRRKNCKEEK